MQDITNIISSKSLADMSGSNTRHSPTPTTPTIIESIYFGNEALNRLRVGVNKLTRAVSSTLGPKGRTVIINKKMLNKPYTTKDGVTVAKNVLLDNPIEQIGVDIVKQSSEKTVSEVGDGTTTTIVLANYMINRGSAHLTSNTSNINPYHLKVGMEKMLENVLKYINSISRKIDFDVEQIYNIAKTSSNNDENIAKIVSDAYSKVGENGMVDVAEWGGTETITSIEQGYKMNSGFTSLYFMNDKERLTCTYGKSFVLLYDAKLKNAQNIFKLIEICHSKNVPLIIIAKEISKELTKLLIMNRQQSNLEVVAVELPFGHEEKEQALEDLHIYTTAAIVRSEDELKKIMVDPKAISNTLGVVANVKITNFDSLFYKYEKIDITNAIKALKEKLNLDPNNKEYSLNKSLVNKRISNLTGGIALINVGSSTEVEAKELRDRIEDAIYACKSAMTNGIIHGGALALLKAYSNNYISTIDLNKMATNNAQSIVYGYDVVLQSLLEPLRVMLNNAGLKGLEQETVFKNLEDYMSSKDKSNTGYDILNEKYVDMYEKGIIDPVDVLIQSLTNAVSVASTILFTNCILNN